MPAMLKNPTPQQIAWFASLIITGLAVVSIVLYAFFHQQINSFLLIGIAGALIFAGTFFTTVYYLERYIYRKIKVIYKTIHDQKVAHKDKTKTVDLNSNIIEEVEKEVNEWAESQKQEIEKYKSWADYRRKFVGDISHELKTPIFNIQGYLHTLLDGAMEDPGISSSFLKKAVKNTDRLQTIVEDLESISRLESGEMILDLQTFDIKELVEEVFEELEFKATSRNVTLKFKEGAAQNFRVKADRETIRQVLSNLIHNSIKYGIDNGVTKVGFYDMDKNVLIEVADNGIGIDKTHLPHLFDRFYRVDKSRSRAIGGSGLGLSIVKHIVEAHSQTINVRSTQDLGSTFGFTLRKA
jgi:two-component system phosphate regulon sensor histidine kinase PhoR